jgi:hypothetical protein
MSKRNIEGVGEVKIKEQENRIVIFVGRKTQVVWANGKWADDNRGNSYLNWRARERLINALNLK